MGSIRTAPCDWPLTELACPALDELFYGEQEALGETLVEAATSLLWNWTGRQFGLCELTVRPCRQDCSPTTYEGWSGIPSPTYTTGMPFVPVLINGEFYNLRCGRRCRDCSCTLTSEIGLPGPVDAVEEVVVDGVTLDPGDYRVDNRRWLVRQDGDRWPTCQDLSKPPGEVGTWSVTYRWGTPVPEGGRLAATVLACEMAKAALGRQCELPQRVQTVTREGVSMAILDSFDGLERGRTGIWLVDSWVLSVTAAPRRSRVMSPDTHTARSTTSP